MKLSIIIPCYNCEATLHEAVASCYEQGFHDDEFEIVMVNDCSTDQTLPIMEEIATLHPNIKILSHDKNQGGGAARNTATGNTKAEVIFCLDSDDILPPQTLNKMLAYLEEKKCDAVTFSTSVNFIGSDLNNISHVVTMAKPGEKIAFIDLLQTPDSMCGLYQVFMFTKTAFNKAGGYPTHHSFDTQGFAWRFLAAGLSAYTCPDTTYLLRVQFKESYYLREYQGGKNNFNWQLIFLENSHLFTPETKAFVMNFDCQDFTRDIYTELLAQPKILQDNYQDLIGKTPNHDKVFVPTKTPVARNSLFGFYLRIKRRIYNLIKQLS